MNEIHSFAIHSLEQPNESSVNGSAASQGDESINRSGSNSMSPPASASSSSLSFMHQLPTDVQIYLANSFLKDDDVNAFAVTDRNSFAAMQRYSWKRDVAMAVCIRRVESSPSSATSSSSSSNADPHHPTSYFVSHHRVIQHAHFGLIVRVLVTIQQISSESNQQPQQQQQSHQPPSTQVQGNSSSVGVVAQIEEVRRWISLLPTSVQSITFGIAKSLTDGPAPCSLDQLPPLQLPPHLVYLTVHNSWVRLIHHFVLPPTLLSLRCVNSTFPSLDRLPLIPPTLTELSLSGILDTGSLIRLTLHTPVLRKLLIHPDPRMKVPTAAGKFGVDWTLPSTLESLHIGLPLIRGLEDEIPDDDEDDNVNNDLAMEVVNARVEARRHQRELNTLIDEAAVVAIKMPSSLTECDFSYPIWPSLVVKPLALLQLPKGLKTFKFPDDVRQSIDELQLPPSLTSLTVPYGWYPPVPGNSISFPRSLVGTALTELIWSCHMSKGTVIPRGRIWLPPTLTRLELPQTDKDADENFSDVILPDNLESLFLSNIRCGSFPTFPLPPRLKSLSVRFPITLPNYSYSSGPSPVAISFNDVAWPQTLSQLALVFSSLDSVPHLSVHGRLPPALTHLSVSAFAPCSFKHLQFPDSCQTFDFSSSIPLGRYPMCHHHLPGSMTHLHIAAFDMKFISEMLQSIVSDTSSSSNSNSSAPMMIVSDSMTSIPLAITAVTPSTLSPGHLRILELTDQRDWGPLKEKATLPLPSTLEVLDLGDLLQINIDECTLPPTLKVLRFGSRFNQVISHLPPSLVELHIGLVRKVEKSFFHHQLVSTPSFNQSLNQLQLPAGLSILRILSDQFNQPRESMFQHVPSTLTLLHVHSRAVIQRSFAHIQLPRACVVQLEADNAQLQPKQH